MKACLLLLSTSSFSRILYSRSLLTLLNCSYEATEDNEISFAEGQKIVHIDTSVSDDWWSGTANDGSVGLFPGMLVIPFSLTSASLTSWLVNQAAYVKIEE